MFAWKGVYVDICNMNISVYTDCKLDCSGSGNCEGTD